MTSKWIRLSDLIGFILSVRIGALIKVSSFINFVLLSFELHINTTSVKIIIVTIWLFWSFVCYKRPSECSWKGPNWVGKWSGRPCLEFNAFGLINQTSFCWLRTIHHCAFYQGSLDRLMKSLFNLYDVLQEEPRTRRTSNQENCPLIPPFYIETWFQIF